MADSLSRRTRVRPPCPGVAGAGTMDDRRQPGGATIVATAGGGRRIVGITVRGNVPLRLSIFVAVLRGRPVSGQSMP